MIDIVIASRNSSQRIGHLLTSIADQTLSGYRCFFVDDCSSDDSVLQVRRSFPWVEVIQLPCNRGPSHARNVGVFAGSHKYLAFFDDDAYVDDPNWLRNALNYFENDERLGQLAALIVNGHDPRLLLDCGIGRESYLFGGLFHGRYRDEVQTQIMERRLVLGACSAGTLVRRSVFDKIGGFDSRYFYAAEDLDLSLRVHLAGFDVRYEPTLLVYHLGSQTMGNCVPTKMYLYRRN